MDARGRGRAGGAGALARAVKPLLGEGAAFEHRGRVSDPTALRVAVERAAAGLATRDVRPGDRVLLHARKGLPFVAHHLAALRLGAISVPLSPDATAAEAAHVRADCGPRLELDADGLDPEGETAGRLQAPGGDCAAPPAPARPAQASDGALLVYTSGTTGRPKGVLLTHGNLAHCLAALHSAWGWRRDDVLLHALPLFHVHGLVVALHGALFAGATVACLDRFEAAEVPALLARTGASVFMGVPTMYHRLAALPDSAWPPLPRLRLCTCGSAPMPPDLVEAFRARSGQVLLERYGMTEALMIASQPLHGPREPGTVGRALPGVELRVVGPVAETPRDASAPSEEGDTSPARRADLAPGEVGEVLVRSASVFAGYHGRPDLTAGVLSPDGWLATGDLGSLAEDGTLRLAGRAKELIISGGFNVHPREVEEALAAHPQVAESGVVGLPDPDLGERVVAAIVPAAPRDPGSPCTPDLAALADFAAARLSRHKRPRAVVVLEALPRNAMGKLDRAALTRLLAARLSGSPAGAPSGAPPAEGSHDG